MTPDQLEFFRLLDVAGQIPTRIDEELAFAEVMFIRGGDAYLTLIKQHVNKAHDATAKLGQALADLEKWGEEQVAKNEYPIDTDLERLDDLSGDNTPPLLELDPTHTPGITGGSSSIPSNPSDSESTQILSLLNTVIVKPTEEPPHVPPVTSTPGQPSVPQPANITIDHSKDTIPVVLDPQAEFTPNEMLNGQNVRVCQMHREYVYCASFRIPMPKDGKEFKGSDMVGLAICEFGSHPIFRQMTFSKSPGDFGKCLPNGEFEWRDESVLKSSGLTPHITFNLKDGWAKPGELIYMNCRFWAPYMNDNKGGCPVPDSVWDMNQQSRWSVAWPHDGPV